MQNPKIKGTATLSHSVRSTCPKLQLCIGTVDMCQKEFCNFDQEIMAGRGTHSRNSAWPTTDQYTFLGSPLNKTVDDLTPQATVPTPTRRATRGLKRQGISNIRQYGGFQKNGIEYRLGDCVLLETDEQDEPYKAKIISCYQNEEGEGRLKVRWLYKEKDVKRTKRGKAKDQFDSDQVCCGGIRSSEKGLCE